MTKLSLNPTTLLMPVPVVMVTAVDERNNPNIITLAWVGTVCSEPPQVGISIRPSRYSHSLVSKSKDFVVNIPSEDLLSKTDYCGLVSGKDVNKFDEAVLTPLPAHKVKAPLIEECPVNMECKLKQVLELGAHDLFIGEIVAIHVDENVLDGNSVNVEKIKPFAYCKHEYWSLKEKLGKYGFTAKQRKVNSE